MQSNPFFQAMFADLMAPEEVPQGFSLGKPNNAVFGKNVRPIPKGDVFPAVADKPTFAQGGGLMSPENTYLAEQEDGDMEEVPPGATAEGVKDDIDIKISANELIVPEDVARWHGLKWFMEAREEAKEGLAQMAAEGLIKRPEGTVEVPQGAGLMSPEVMPDEEDEYSEGGTSGGSDDNGKDGNEDGGSKNDTSSSPGMSGVDNAGFGNNESAVVGAKEGNVDAKDEEMSPAATTMGFNPGKNPEMGGSRGRSTQNAAIDNVANLTASPLGQMGSRFGGSFGVHQDRDTGLFGTAANMNYGTALGAAATMMSGLPGLGTLGGYAANAMGRGSTNLGVDMTNNGMQGLQDSNVAGFGPPGTGLSNPDTNEGLTAMESLMRNPY